MTPEQAFKLAQKTDFLMSCQERTGICFDQEKAKKLYEFCVEEMERIEAEVEPQLPLKPMNKSELSKATPPKVQFKNSKEGLVPSANCLKFFDKVSNSFTQCGIVRETKEYYGWIGEDSFLLPYNKPVTTMTTMRLKNQADIKNWLINTHNWRPTIWNHKKDQHGKFIRENGKLVKTSPKFHDKGTLCSNLENLGETIEIVKPVVRWLSLRNRRSVIYNPDKGTGWLSNARLERDGRLPAGASNITNTHRQKHKVVANIPRVSSYLGKEMRELFCASEGNVLVGYDARSLEAFIKGHFCFPYEGGEEYFKKITHPDFDEHQATADAWNLESRQDAKPGNYGLQYNQGVAGLADTYKISRAEAQFRYDAYWELNRPWKLCIEALERHWKTQGKRGVRCGVTGHFLMSRSSHSLGSLIAQHVGAIAMDYSGAIMDKRLGGIKYDKNGLPVYIYKGYEVRRVLYYHDELAFECKPEITQEILSLGTSSIAKAGVAMNLNVPLAATGSIGHSWGDIH